MRPPHARALGEVRDLIRISGGTLDLLRYEVEGGRLILHLMLDAALARDSPEALGEWEPFMVTLGPDYPFVRPVAEVNHERFAGFENVMRGRGICLYANPDSEWEPHRGMYGFVEQLWEWLRRTVRGDHTPPGGLFHAPVGHHITHSGHVVVITSPPSAIASRVWLGTAELWRPYPPIARWDLAAWCEGGPKAGATAAVLLLPERVGFHFPESLGALCAFSEGFGVAAGDLLQHLAAVAYRLPAGTPLLFVVGTPLRNEPGTVRDFHFTVLLVDGAPLGLLKQVALPTSRAGRERNLAAASAAHIPFKLALTLRRDETGVVPRDGGTPLAWFKGKRVALWGCGAVGARVAHHLARAGVAGLALYDRGFVTPGVLSRQPYADPHVGLPKALVLADEIRRVAPDCDVTPHANDVVGLPGDWTDGADILVDATANVAVASHLDTLRSQPGSRRVPALSFGVDGRAERALATCLPGDSAHGPSSAHRELYLNLLDTPGLRHARDAFFPAPGSPRREAFFPEPGCADATFVGSDADLAFLTSSMLNWSASRLSGADPSAASFLITQPHVVASGEEPFATVNLAEPDVLRDPDRDDGFTVYLRPGIREEIGAFVTDAAGRNGTDSETGGVVFGSWDPAVNRVYVDAVLPAPPDSVEGPDVFVCGTVGVDDSARSHSERTGGTTEYLGTWHTHVPYPPEPSARDLGSARVYLGRDRNPERFLMLIVQVERGALRFKAHLFDRATIPSEPAT